MSGLSWGRLYYEWAHDLKIQTLPEAFQRRHAMLLCMHIEGLLHPADDDAAFYMRVSPAEWLETKAVFMARGLMDADNHLINWERRQFKSDGAAARMRKYRESLADRNGYVTVTPPDTETDTETEAEMEEKNSPPTPPPGGGIAEDDSSRPRGSADSPEKRDSARPAGPVDSAAKTESSPPGPAVSAAKADSSPPGPAVSAAKAEKPWRGVAEAYHRLLPHLPPHQVWSDRDVRHFQRNRQLDPVRGSPEFWSRHIFPKVAQSPFLSGRCPPRRGQPWRASLPWLLNPDNVAKILNGHYAEGFGGAGESGGAASEKRLTSTSAGGKSAGPAARLPAPQEFSHEIKPLGSKGPAKKR